MHLILGSLAILAIALGIIFVAAFLIHMVARDRSHGASGNLGRAMLEVQSLLEPEKHHAVEEMHAAEEDRDEDKIARP